MKSDQIETPMYFVDGFVDGMEKRFPEGSSSHDEIATIKQKATSFLRRSGKKIKKLEETRQAIDEDPTINDAAKAVKLYRKAEKSIGQIQREADKLPNIAKYAQNLDSDVDNTIEAIASTDFARETRQRIVEMDKEKRATFVSKAIQADKDNIAAYALGAPAFLSGIPDKAHSDLKKRYKEQFYGKQMQTVEALNKLQDNIEKGLKATTKLKRKIRGKASLNDAIDKSNKTQALLNSQ